MLKGGFPDEEICCFFGSYRSPLLPPLLGASGEAFSRQLPFARMLMQPLWQNEGVEVLPQFRFMGCLFDMGHDGDVYGHGCSF